MRKLAIIVFVISTSFSGFGQFSANKIKKFEVKETGFNIKMNFQPKVDKTTYKGLTIKITPISADVLNEAFIKDSNLNGQFKYSHYDSSVNSYFLKKKRGKKIKSDLEFFLEGISWLIDNEYITQSEYNKLEKQIIYYFDEDFAKEYYNTNRITSCNPYYLNGHYLNVFKLNITNPTSSHIVIDKEFIVENGDIILNQLSTDNLLQHLNLDKELNIKKIMSLERHNLEKGTIIPPNSEVEKHFAVLPVDFNNSILKVSIKGQPSKYSWEIIKDEDRINRKSVFYEINAIYRGSNNFLFNTISGENIENIFIENEKLYLGEGNLNSVFDIITVAVYRKGFYFGRNKDVQAVSLVDLEKNKRGSLKLEHSKIEELTKVEDE